MNITLPMIGVCAFITLGAMSAHAGPCSTEMKDAGSGPTPGANTEMTTGATKSEHPPTSITSKELGDRAASPSDVRDQTAGKPTAAQQAQGKKPADC